MTDVDNPGGEDGKPEDQNSGGSDPGGSDDNKLADASTEELVDIIRATRREAAEFRTRAQKAEGKVGDLTKSQKSLEERIGELEAETKTAEEKEAERIEALEAKASEVDALKRYQNFVKTQYEAEEKFVESIEDEERKGAFTDLLESFEENDHVGRLKAIRALKAAQGTRKEMDPKDTGNPGETGGGASEKSLADKLGWSADGMAEAKMARLAQ